MGRAHGNSIKRRAIAARKHNRRHYGQQAQAHTEYKRARTVTYEFKDVTLDDVDQIELSRYLATSQVAPGLEALANALKANRLYVITSTIQSRSFTTVAQTKDGVAVPLNVPVIRVPSAVQ